MRQPSLHHIPQHKNRPAVVSRIATISKSGAVVFVYIASIHIPSYFWPVAGRSPGRFSATISEIAVIRIRIWKRPSGTKRVHSFNTLTHAFMTAFKRYHHNSQKTFVAGTMFAWYEYIYTDTSHSCMYTPPSILMKRTMIARESNNMLLAARWPSSSAVLKTGEDHSARAIAMSNRARTHLARTHTHNTALIAIELAGFVGFVFGRL